MLKAILKGSLGASIRQADIGSADKMECSGLTLEETHRGVPKDMLPNAIANNPGAYNSLSRPDATLQCHGSPPRIEVMEVKICRDTDRNTQLERADKQHAELLSHMRGPHGSTLINLNTFAFGATGTIYTDNLEQLVKLGVDHASAKQTLRKVHTSLVQDLHTIVCARRAQEGPPTHTYPPNAHRPRHKGCDR